MPLHASNESEWLGWKGWLIGTVGASVIFAGIWGLSTQDKTQALLGAALPWAFFGICLFIALAWAIVMIPLLSLVAKVFGGRKRDALQDMPSDET